MSSTKVIIITGATDAIGIGLATAKALCESLNEATTIILTSRNGVKGQETVEANLKHENEKVKVVVKQLLLDDDDDVARFTNEVQEEYGHVDVLVNNAATHLDYSVGQGKISMRDAFNQSCNTNIASTYLFTQSMVPLLLSSSSPRLIFVSTGLSSIGDTVNAKYPLDKPTEHTGWPKPFIFNVNTYRASKAGLNAMAIQWSKMLKNDGVKVFILDPGLLSTNLGGIKPETRVALGAPPASVGGEFFRDVIVGKWDHEQARLLGRDGVLSW